MSCPLLFIINHYPPVNTVVFVPYNNLKKCRKELAYIKYVMLLIGGHLRYKYVVIWCTGLKIIGGHLYPRSARSGFMLHQIDLA